MSLEKVHEKALRHYTCPGTAYAPYHCDCVSQSNIFSY